MNPNFKVNQIHGYNNLIESEEIRSIIKNIPDGLTKLEQAYYIYIELGKIVKEDPNYVLRSNGEKKQYYDDAIDEQLYGICKSISELYVGLLNKVGISADLIREVPESINGSHVDTALKIEGATYIVNLISDLANIKSRRRINSFGVDINRKLNDRAEFFIRQAEQMGITGYNLRKLLSEAQQKNDCEDIHRIIDQSVIGKDKKGQQLHREIDRLATLANYVKNIEEAYGKVATLTRIDLEKMDMRVGYSYFMEQSENAEETRGIYGNDIFHAIEDEMQNPEKVKRYVYGGMDIPEEEQLEYKLKYICEVMGKCIPQNGESSYLEEITNGRRLLESIVTPSELRRITQYAIKVTGDYRDIISVLKVEPVDEDKDNTYYIYSKEKRTYKSLKLAELEEYIGEFDTNEVSIIGIGREYSKELSQLRGREIFDELKRKRKKSTQALGIETVAEQKDTASKGKVEKAINLQEQQNNREPETK